MRAQGTSKTHRFLWLALTLPLAFSLAVSVLLFAGRLAQGVRAAAESAPSPAAPIPPPDGYPKLSLSTKRVSPALAHTGGETLHYRIEIRNTGAYTASGVSFQDLIPAHTTYNDDARASASPFSPQFANGTLLWIGDVGFDETVLVSFSVDVAPTYAGLVTNTAVIRHPLIPRPITVTAQAVVTDSPLLEIDKSTIQRKPGPNKPLTYEIEVTNFGQPAIGLPVMVSDKLPVHTTFRQAGPDGQPSPDKRTVTWQRTLDLATGETSVFTFSVDVADVPSGTVLTNDQYQVSSSATGVTAGEAYTVTVVDPIFFINKTTLPDPPGSNRELTYTLTVLNRGSLATNLVVTDRLPSGVSYRRGGLFQNGEVRWTLPQLGSGGVARFSYTVYVGDVAQVSVLNDQYSVCSAEGVCAQGPPLTSLVQGPSFEADIWLDPIAKKPGGGNAPVTPTIVIRNLGPGSALDASAQMTFGRISVQFSDLRQYPSLGSFSPGPVCGDKCLSYRWVGDLAAGQAVTITTVDGQNSIGGEQGTHYTATLVMTDQLGTYVTPPYSKTVLGLVTHYANLIPTKRAPPLVGAGQVMTYSFQIFNSGLSTDVPPYPTLTDTLPASTTLVRVNDGGAYSTQGGPTVVAWTLPAMSTGSLAYRSYAVQVADGLLSGTQIINDDYRTSWYNVKAGGILTHTGPPVTTTVREVGLIDSFKSVTPTTLLPGPGNLLTYTLHVVNSSPASLYGVELYDIFPWEHSTYRRDAIASAGQLISDIVSLAWSGDLAPNSVELITFSVMVDPDFSGPLTNTFTISHSSLLTNAQRSTVAYVTDKPVLRLTKTASPDPVRVGGELLYTLKVSNLGQRATVLVLTDTLPANTEYITGSVTGSGLLVGDTLRWTLALLEPGQSQTFAFKVRVLGGILVKNEKYRVACTEGVSAVGLPVYTRTRQKLVYLPVLMR